MKRSIAYKKKESFKPLKRSKTPNVYKSSTLDNHNDVFIKNNSKNELEKKTPILIRNIPIIKLPSFIFPKDLLKTRKIYNRFKPIKDYKKYIDIFFQYKITKYKNNKLTNTNL